MGDGHDPIFDNAHEVAKDARALAKALRERHDAAVRAEIAADRVGGVVTRSSTLELAEIVERLASVVENVATDRRR